MKFKTDTPNLYVKISNKYIQRATGKKGFFFDAQGEYETDNEFLIKALSQSFEVVQTEQEPEPKKKLVHCKKCDFVTDNKGSLMQHYKNEHPKEG